MTERVAKMQYEFEKGNLWMQSVKTMFNIFLGQLQLARKNIEYRP